MKTIAILALAASVVGCSAAPAGSDTATDRIGKDPLITATRDAVCAETREEREMAIVTLAEEVAYEGEGVTDIVSQVASEADCSTV